MPEAPAGIVSRKIYQARCDKQRLWDISQGMVRYADKGKEIPLVWTLELNEIVERLVDSEEPFVDKNKEQS